MLILGPLGFLAPWLLVGLVALPLLWWLLRAIPPAPVRRRFPGIVLLFGLKDRAHEAERTPWWLLLLRTLALAAAILGFAGPVLNPQPPAATDAPLLVLLDGTWADARDWPRRIARAGQALDEAAQAGRPVALVTLTDPPPGPLPFQDAEAWKQRLAGVRPLPWAPDPERLAGWPEGWDGGRFDTLWLSDGLDRPGRGALLTALQAQGAVRVFESARPLLVLLPPLFREGVVELTLRRLPGPGPLTVPVIARGPGPDGGEVELARAEAAFAPGAGEAELRLSLPAELRNRITRFEVEGLRSAGAVALADDALRRRKVAVISALEGREELQLLSPTHYLEEALRPSAELLHGGLAEVLPANPDVIILADIATLPAAEAGPLTEWIEKGGLLLRFAGPRLAASDAAQSGADPLLPVRLRAGGRTVGGAMSWGEPRALAPFPEGSPFFGLAVPDEVTVSAQVLAQPDPDLPERTIAALADGTPLVTRKALGAGQVVLFHVTANAEWSSLPLSGLFVEMLQRLAVTTRPERPGAAELAGTTWVPQALLDGFGRLEDAGTLPGVAGADLARGEPGPATPPGLYAGEAGGEGRLLALNVAGPGTRLAPALWPASVTVEGLAAAPPLPLKGALLALALLALALDILATLWLGGRLRGPRAVTTAPAAPPAATASAALLLALLALAPQGAQADAAADAFAIQATGKVVLAHVLTGDKATDDLAQAGMLGLSLALFQRTSVEPGPPMAVDLERDELAFFPFLYWPVTVAQPIPSDAAYAKLNRYLRGGGMILFDTRDGDLAGLGATTPEGQKLQVLAAPLDIPPLAPVPADHILTRSFYLIRDFPGRFASPEIWAEAAPPDAEQVEGMPFRNLNDNVTPVVIGGNDWASAWAVDGFGAWLVPVGRGYSGERQREQALRFGVNLMMNVLTGNYKSDQVHVPALLERLGQ